MTFLVDAQLPRRLAHRLRDRGHDALHTLDLERGTDSRQVLLRQALHGTGDLRHSGHWNRPLRRMGLRNPPTLQPSRSAPGTTRIDQPSSAALEDRSAE
jgi:hypothetical protein